MSLKTLCHPVIAERATGSRLKLNIFKTILAGLCFFSLTACGSSNQAPPNLNMVISVSTDGNYAIATNTNKQAILWNLKDHSYRVVFKDANVYSAYFIKNTDDFMYQNDKTNEVVIENVNGQTIKTFNPGFPTYGEVMTSDLQNYFASDRWFQLYKINMQTGQKQQFFYYYCGPNYKDGIPPPKGMPYACQEFLGSDQLFGLNLTPDDKTLISAASGAMYIWDVATTKQLKLIIKNDAQTVAAISPDGSYVVTGDIEGLGYFQSLNRLSQKGYTFAWDTRTPLTTNAYSRDSNNLIQILTIKFIDSQHALTFFGAFPQRFYFATLYSPLSNHKFDSSWNITTLEPLKYLPLVDNPFSNMSQGESAPFITDDFSRDQAIDTSPSAHILVMSQQNANGIIVYKYDPTTQTLNRDWVGTVKSSWW